MKLEEVIEEAMGGEVCHDYDGITVLKPCHRSSVLDFLGALGAVDDLLAKYSAIKQDVTGAKWRTQSPRDHLAHAYGHVRASIRFIDGRAEDDCEEDLASTACRALMALQLYLEQKAQAQPPPPAR